jgi:hypothetical protein
MIRALRSLLLASLLALPAVAHADMTFSQAYFYGQRYSVSGLRDHGAGYTGGGYLSFDWNSPSSKTSNHIGLITECQVGLGTMPDVLIGIDLIADLLGIGGRYEINKDFQLGFFFEPVEIFATPVGGYIGSKLVAKVSFRQLQLELGRGGNGVFYGWVVPKDGEALQLVSLQYLAPGDRTFGLRYLRVPSRENVGTGIMLYLGWWM